MARITTLNQEQIKEINRVNIVNILRTEGETTKQEIAKTLGLSIPTVTTNIQMLMEEGLVTEAGVARSTGGRKPVILHFEADARYSVGVDITPEKIRLVLVNLDLAVLDEIAIDFKVKDAFDETMNRVYDQVALLIQNNDIDKDKVVGIGISLPGLVDEDQKVLENAPNIQVRDYSFLPFQKKIGLSVNVENEANIAAFAEASIGAGRNKSNMVYVSITDGVGTGIIIDGHIYKSSHKKAGEFGHMRISDETLQCNCGRTGCWELYASKRALLRYCSEGREKPLTSLDDIFKKVSSQENEVRRGVERYTESLFIGIENIILGLNPEYVIIGGELGRYSDMLIQQIGSSHKLKSSYIEYEGTKVLFTELGDRGALLGAALLPLESIFSVNRSII